MRIKIFENGNAEELENEVNQWLSEHPEIELVDSNQTETAFLVEEDIIANITFSIIYRKRM